MLLLAAQRHNFITPEITSMKFYRIKVGILSSTMTISLNIESEKFFVNFYKLEEITAFPRLYFTVEIYVIYYA